MSFLKSNRLHPGDSVAVLSPSWGGPEAYPHVFECGVRNLESLFGLKVVEFPTARMSASDLYFNPKRRAEDLNAAFADPSIKAIIASIGGNESVRILPFLDIPAIVKQPKILMGYSDVTTLTSTLNLNGLVTFNGPAVMAGFAQMRHLPPEFRNHVRDILMDPAERYAYKPYSRWCDRYAEWSAPGYAGQVRELFGHDGWRWLQGEGQVSGTLYGGCIEVLEFLKGTPWWPSLEFWEGKLLFFETSEEKPAVEQVEYWMRNYGSMGVLERAAGILFGRARSYTSEEKERLYTMLARLVGYEFGRPDMPIVANMDFGHTDPQWVMPLGIRAELDCEKKTFSLLEAAVL